MKGGYVMVYFLSVLYILVSILLALVLFNKHLPVWFCHKMGWHLAPTSFTGRCSRCGKKVLQDSQGNWF